MATQTIRIAAPLASGSYTVDVQDEGSNTNAYTGVSLTAEENPIFWTFPVTAATAGMYAYQVKSGSTVLAYGWFESNDDEVVTIQESPTRLPQSTATGLTQGDLDAIGEVVAENQLSGPAMIAAANVAGGNTYCTVADVESRLTPYGVDWIADVVTVDGERNSSETSLVERAIDYCNTIIDTYIQGFVADINTRPAGNIWLRDRCIDLACVRVFTLGGRDTPPVLQTEADEAMLWLQRAQNRDIQIPAFNYRSQVLHQTHRKVGTPTVVRF